MPPGLNPRRALTDHGDGYSSINCTDVPPPLISVTATTVRRNWPTPSRVIPVFFAGSVTVMSVWFASVISPRTSPSIRLILRAVGVASFNGTATMRGFGMVSG